VNGLVRWSYDPAVDSFAGLGTQEEGQPEAVPPTLLLDYDVAKERFTVSRSVRVADFVSGVGGDYFLRQAPTEESTQWGPFASVYGLKRSMEFEPSPPPTFFAAWYLFKYLLKGGFGAVPDMEFQTGFGRLHDSKTTRITAVRPVWTASSGKGATAAAGVSVSVHTKNKPYEDETTAGPFSVAGDDGWIGTGDTVVGSYHSVTLKFDGGDAFETAEIHEIEGLEIQYLEGGDYGA
jgi:hypothetical protein